jgi:hypothetical protein
VAEGACADWDEVVLCVRGDCVMISDRESK